MRDSWFLLAAMQAALMASGCGVEIDSKKMFSVKMYGAFEAPSSSESSSLATETFEPISQSYTLTGVTITPDPASSSIGAISLYDLAPEEFSIVNRSQIVFEKEIDEDWVGVTFASLTAQIDATVTGKSRFSEDHRFVLGSDTTYDLTTTVPFTVEKGQGVAADIKVKWKDTIYEDPDNSGEYLMAQPDFEVVVSID